MQIAKTGLPGQIVLVLQGGGALGAYQVGVYQALHEAGLEPDWIVGTSIGAINGAIIAGNPPDKRLAQLTQFWEMVRSQSLGHFTELWPAAAAYVSRMDTYTRGVGGSFKPNLQSAWHINSAVGIEPPAFCSTAPLPGALSAVPDFASLD